MSNQIDRYREVLRGWFDLVNTGDLKKIEEELGQYFTPNFILHDLTYGKPQTLAEWFGAMSQWWSSIKDLRAEFEDCFGEGDRTVTRGFAEWVDLDTQAKKRMDFIFIDRFEGNRIAEEWCIDFTR